MTKEEIVKILNDTANRVEFNEEEHTYLCDGIKLPSVSGFIKPWNKNFNDMMNPQSPSFNKFLAKSMPYFQDRGTRIHKFSEDVDKGFMKQWDKDLWEYERYYKFFHRKYLASGKWSIIAIEAPIFHCGVGIDGVAGMIDRLYMNNETKEIYLLDVKSGATQPINKYQQAMYWLILKKMGIKVDKCFLLSLKGGANLKEIPMSEIMVTNDIMEKWVRDQLEKEKAKTWQDDECKRLEKEQIKDKCVNDLKKIEWKLAPYSIKDNFDDIKTIKFDDIETIEDKEHRIITEELFRIYADDLEKGGELMEKEQEQDTEFKELVKELDALIDKRELFESQLDYIFEDHDRMVKEEEVVINLLKSFENKRVIHGKRTFESKWIKTTRFDTSKFKSNQPELYKEYIVDGTSKRFVIKKIS